MKFKPRGIDRRQSTEASALERRRRADRRALGTIGGQAFFRGIPFSTLERLVAHCQVQHLDPGECLLAPGQQNDSLYLLLDGQLKVHVNRLDSQGGILIEPGECTGEISIIDGKPATAFVLAEQPSTILAIPETRFWGEFIAQPEIARNFMHLFADRFRARNRLMQQAAEQRLRYEHLQKELGIAQEIQAGMLPRALDLQPEIDIVAEMVPARHVGGDFYDVFAVGNDEYCIAIGDVAGKGVPAALFMVRAMTLLRTEMLKRQPLDIAIQQINVALCKDNPIGLFVTLVVAIINRRTGVFRYTMAGHNPLIYAAAGKKFRFLTRPAGIVAGIDEHAAYEVASLNLAQGDTILIYTDGITEAMNQQRALFTEERLLECLDEAPPTRVSDLAGRVRRAVSRFVGNASPSDDLTLVILRFQGA